MYPPTRTSLTLGLRLSDAELLQYCHDPSIPERERLILTKRNSTPGQAELRRAQVIAKEQLAAAQGKSLSEKKELSYWGAQAHALGRTKSNKLEGFFGERPTSFQRPPSRSPSASPNNSPRQGNEAVPRQNAKRLQNFFGQRPPSELISSNLEEYFPDQERHVLEETVRNSIRRSTRMSHHPGAGRRFSTATTASISSFTRDKDIPPLPIMDQIWKDGPPRLTNPRPPRPLSLRRAVSSASYPPSIVESIIEDDADEGPPTEETNNSDWAFITEDNGEDTIRPLAVSAEEEKPEEDDAEYEDSEEEYEEGEFDAVGGGPTRWIRGALIGMGSFGSVYLGMNRTSGELMAVKQVELPSQEVQGEQRKQSMLIALQREIALLRDLTHQNIVHYIGNPRGECT
jgi:mitogen-activated protein kinase kinase kinase